MKSKCVLQKLRWRMDCGRLIHITCLLGRVLFVVRIILFFFSHRLKWQLLRSKNQECQVVDFLWWLNCSWLLSPLMLLHNGFITHFTKYRLLQTKNKITSVKHWHCSMICLLTATKKYINEYARKEMHLFGVFWLDSRLATEFNTLVLYEILCTRDHYEQRLYHKCNNSVPVTSSTRCA